MYMCVYIYIYIYIIYIYISSHDGISDVHHIVSQRWRENREYKYLRVPRGMTGRNGYRELQLKHQ